MIAKDSKAIDLLQTARSRGVFISLDNGELSIKYSKGKSLDPELLEEIKNNKTLIIDFLNEKKSKSKKIFETENKIHKIARDSFQYLPLSFSQERMWFIDQLEGSVQYHMPTVLHLKGNLNKDGLSHALRMIVDRHEVLRTVFLQQEGQAYQSIKATEGWQLQIIDGSGYKHDAEALQRYIQVLISEPFNLSKDYMIRASLISLSEEEHVLVLTMHHIASDGWSISIIVKEVVELYAAYVEDRPARLVELPLQYADYAIWQRTHLQGEVLHSKIEYWKQKLGGVTPLQLPTDHQRPPVKGVRGASKGFSLDRALSGQLKALSQQHGTTLYMTLLAAFKVLLHRYSGQQDICVGSPIANRTQQEVEGLIGFFVNTLALRTEVNGDASFIALLQQVKATTMEAYEHQDISFEKVVEVVVKERDLSRNPLFQVMFILQNTPEVSQLQLGEVELSTIGHENLNALFDITFNLTDGENGLYGSVQFATDLYNEATIIRMTEHFRQLLHSIVTAPQQKIGSLPMLGYREREQLLLDFNNTLSDYPSNKTIVNLFEEQVAKTPQAIAITFESEQLTYEELNKRSNQLANYLAGKGVKPETLVPICAERSIEMIVGILGILKAGGAYVPIDMKYPQERINFMLEDTRASVVLGTKASKAKLQTTEIFDVIEVDGDWSVIDLQPVENLTINMQANHLAYIIYTSGSTGKPKGVMVEHRNVVSLVRGVDYVSLKPKDVLLSTGSFSFDATTLEYWGMLLNGGQLILCSETTLLTIELLKKEINTRGVTKMWFTSSWFNQIVETDITIFENLQTIFVGGEKLSEHHIDQIRKTYPDIDVLNAYGPTENTTFSLTHKITEKAINSNIPIGRPLTNRSAYILNEQFQLVPIGIRGEIFVGGAGVSRGYLNHADLSAQKFISNPFNKESGAKLYRTGDFGRWLADGTIEYLGRMDDQVKIRGYRIEPGEIENVLQQCSLVRHAVVLVKEDAEHNKQLVGYVVPEGSFDSEAIISYLKGKLPEYMVPALWMTLEQLPLTPNGKVDKKALPDFDGDGFLKKTFKAANTELEASLVEIWKKLLKVEQVGIQNNFFELGGHSLLAMRLIASIRRELGLEVHLVDIFENTIQSLAEKIKNQQPNADFVIESQLKLDNTLSSAKILEATRLLETGRIEWSSNGNEKFMIPIKKGGTKTPFFGIISFNSYRLLGKYMPSDRPLYYLPPTQSASVEEIASHFIKEIKLIQPSGPYNIGGFCAAGSVALEMAQQLKAQGDEVSALVLFEFYSPYIMMSKRSFKYKQRKLLSYGDRLRSINKSNQSRFDLIKFIIKKSLAKFRKKVSKRPPSRFITSPEFYKYVYKPYSGKVILFQASIPPLEMVHRPLMGWGDYFSGDVNLIRIDGGHLGILREPGVLKLAEKLETMLEEVNNALRPNNKIESAEISQENFH